MTQCRDLRQYCRKPLCSSSFLSERLFQLLFVDFLLVYILVAGTVARSRQRLL